MILPPLNITLSSETKEFISVSSVDDCTWFNITGVKYADFVSIDTILNAVAVQKIPHVKIIRSNDHISKFTDVGVLVLYVNKNTILIIDEHRDYFIELR